MREIFVYWSQVSAIWELMQAAAYDLLSEDEKSRECALVRSDDAKAYHASHVCIRLIVSFVTGIEARLITLSYDSIGRPFFSHPASLRGFGVSLSHAEKHIAVAIQPESTLCGVDIESLPLVPGYMDVSDIAFTPKELSLLLHDLSQLENIFSKLWTTKEAVLKAIGKGFIIEPRSLCLYSAITSGTPVVIGADEIYVTHQSLPLEASLSVAYAPYHKVRLISTKELFISTQTE